MKCLIALMLFSMSVVASECDDVAMLAYEIQFNRQHGIADALSPMSADTLIQMDKTRVPIEQHPAWKMRRVRDFADEWQKRCLSGE